jgi:hypothetical protein
MAYADALSIPFYKILTREKKEDPRILSRKEAIAYEIGDDFDSGLYDKQMEDSRMHSKTFDETFRKELAPLYGENKVERAIYHLSRPAGSSTEQEGLERAGWVERLMRKASNRAVNPVAERKPKIILDKSLTQNDVERIGNVDNVMERGDYASFADFSDLAEYRGTLDKNRKWFKAGRGLSAVLAPMLGATGAITVIGDVMTAHANSEDGYIGLIAWDMNTEPDMAAYRMYHIPQHLILEHPELYDPEYCDGPQPIKYKNWNLDTIVHPKTTYVLRGVETGALSWITLTAVNTQTLESDHSNTISYVGVLPGNMDRTSPGSQNRVDGYDLVKWRAAYNNFVRNGIYDWEADLNGDGGIDGIDYNMFRMNYGKNQPNELGLVYLGEDIPTTNWCDI